ncbi:MAG: SpoIIE family protein phosphatase, partial [bacterium]|nr:SpoIIE family protein phosphatase [bacterium]
PDDFLIAIFSDGILEAMPQPDLAHKVDYLQSMNNEADMHRFVTQLRTTRDLPDDVTLLTIRKGTHHARR